MKLLRITGDFLISSFNNQQAASLDLFAELRCQLLLTLLRVILAFISSSISVDYVFQLLCVLNTEENRNSLKISLIRSFSSTIFSLRVLSTLAMIFPVSCTKPIISLSFSTACSVSTVSSISLPEFSVELLALSALILSIIQLSSYSGSNKSLSSEPKVTLTKQ